MVSCSSGSADAEVDKESGTCWSGCLVLRCAPPQTARPATSIAPPRCETVSRIAYFFFEVFQISLTLHDFLTKNLLIVGTLINVGRGKIPASSISDIIAQKDRTLAGDCVPPNGLLLKEVYY